MMKDYSVSIDSWAQIDEVAGRLERAGFQVTSRLAAVGVIVGSVDEAMVPAIRDIVGIAAVEESRRYQQLPAQESEQGESE